MGFPTITESIDIDMPSVETRTAWNAYVTSLIVGSGSLLTTPEILARLRRTDAEGGSVQFAQVSSSVTRMTLALDYEVFEWPRDRPRREEQLHHEMRTLLQSFKQFVESRER